jgi:hypothetical protein
LLLSIAATNALAEAAGSTSRQRMKASGREGFRDLPGLRRVAKLLLAPPPQLVLRDLTDAVLGSAEEEGARWHLAGMLVKSVWSSGGCDLAIAEAAAAPDFVAAAEREARMLAAAWRQAAGGDMDASTGGAGVQCAISSVLVLARAQAAVLAHLLRAQDLPGAAELAPAQAAALLHALDCLDACVVCLVRSAARAPAAQASADAQRDEQACSPDAGPLAEAWSQMGCGVQGSAGESQQGSPGGAAASPGGLAAGEAVTELRRASALVDAKVGVMAARLLFCLCFMFIWAGLWFTLPSISQASSARHGAA